MMTPATMPPMMGLDSWEDGRGGDEVGVEVGVLPATLASVFEGEIDVEGTVAVVESPVVDAAPSTEDDDKAPPSTCANLTTSFPAPSQHFLSAPQHHVSLFASSVPLVHGVICELP